MILPMIKKQTTKVMMAEALTALRKFDLMNDRSGFGDWLKKWHKELKMAKTAEGGCDDSPDEGVE